MLFDWICVICCVKLFDLVVIGNVGSFFKNFTVMFEQCVDIIVRESKVVHYFMFDGMVKLVVGWLIDVCGWKGCGVGNVGVYEK